MHGLCEELNLRDLKGGIAHMETISRIRVNLTAQEFEVAGTETFV